MNTEGPYGDETGTYGAATQASPFSTYGSASTHDSDYLAELAGAEQQGGKFFESLTHTAGTGYLAGLFFGSGYSFLNGYANARKLPDRNARVVFNAVANSVGKNGTRIANLTALYFLFQHITYKKVKGARQGKSDLMNFIPMVSSTSGLALAHYAHLNDINYRRRPMFIFKGIMATCLLWTVLSLRYDRPSIYDMATRFRVYTEPKDDGAYDAYRDDDDGKDS